MSDRLAALVERRKALVADSDRDRAALAASFNAVRHKLTIANAAVDTLRHLNRHRVLVGAAAVWLILAPRSAGKWIRRAVTFLPLAIGGYRLISGRSTRRVKTVEANPNI